MKLNKPNEYEVITIQLDENRTPIAFNNKVKELLEDGSFDNEEDAKEYIRTTPIDLELYYEINKGLFAVESDAVECVPIYSPYTAERCEDYDED